MDKPLLFRLAHARTGRLFPYFSHGRNTVRAMRVERQTAILALVHAMLEMACLQFGGAVCAVRDNMARPLTVPELAKVAGLPQRKTERCLKDLQEMGFIETGKQKRSAFQGGSLLFVVSSVMRMFTAKFWQALGLWEMFQKGVEYAKKQAKKVLHLVVPTYRKALKRAKQVKNLVSSLIESVSGGGLDDRAFLNCPWRTAPSCPRPCSRAAECRR